VVVVIVAVAGGGSDGAALALALAIALPAIICGFIYFAVRLSLASPLTFDTGRIDPMAAWRMTRGRFWPLLGAYFIAFALSIVVVVLTFAIAAAAIAVIGGIGALGPAFQSDLGTVGAVLTPTRLAYLAVSAVGQALIWPVTMTPPAAIYRALAGGAAGRVFE
jgi:hypothetical protein